MTRKKLNTIFLIVIFFVFSFLSIGYSVLSQQLTISGDVAYRYFEPTLYNVLKREKDSGGLAREYMGSHQDSMAGIGTEKIYHYYASNDNEGTQIQEKNNVVFAGQCWQMIRTTDTGGVKMIYNGEAENNQCLTSRKFKKGFTKFRTMDLSSNYWYGTDYTYDSNNKTFTLTGNLEQATWNLSTGPNLVGKYTCMSGNAGDSCSAIFLVDGVEDELNGKILVFTTVPDDYDIPAGFYGIGVLPFHHYSSPDSPAYVGYMYGTDYKTGTFVDEGNNIIWGTGATWDGSQYTLTGTVSTTVPDYEHKYTCEGGQNTCNNLYYVYNMYNSSSGDITEVSFDYVILDDGVTDPGVVLNNMFKDNTNDSTVKLGIESWYKHNMLSYDDYIEDTIFCNNRYITDYGGWTIPSITVNKTLKFKEYNATTDLSCENITDKFSTLNSQARTNYKVGLMSSAEMNLVNNINGMLDSTRVTWLMSPHSIQSDPNSLSLFNVSQNQTGFLNNRSREPLFAYPAISLNPGTEFMAGDGSRENPYIVGDFVRNTTFSDSAISSGTKNVTITFPSGCGTSLTCKYKKDNGSEVNVTTSSVVVPFTSAGKISTAIIKPTGSTTLTNSHNVTFNALYVSSSGNDSTGFGSIAAPYATLTKAYEMSDPTSTIYVMNNITPTETTTFDENKNITITSCTKASNTSCPTSTANSIIRGSGVTDNLLELKKGTTNLTTITLDGNSVSSTSSMIKNRGTLNINIGSTLQNATNSSDGGAIYNDNGNVTITSGTIQNNSADRGGAIFNERGTIEINSGTISGNSAVTNSGAIWSASTLNINGGTISGNQSERGGAIHCTYNSYGTCVLTMTGGSINNNTATVNGGAIATNYLDNNIPTINISGGQLNGNQAERGGAIYQKNATTVIGAATLSTNSATAEGGAIWVYEGGTMTINGTTITGNTSGESGGAIKNSNGEIIINSGTISNNTATTGNSGAIWNAGILDIKGGTISNNSGNNAGAINCTWTESSVCRFNMTGGTISSNTSNGTGGAIWLNSDGTVNPTFTMSGGEISGNTSSSHGGGVYSKGTFNMSNGSIKNNTAGTYGGGLFCTDNTSCNMSGGSITGNTATSSLGGGVRVNGTLTLTGGTIQNNDTPNDLNTFNISVHSSGRFIDSRSGYTFNNTVYNILSAVNNNYAVDLESGQVHGNVQLYSKGTSNNQKWKIIPTKVINGVVYYSIYSQAQTSQVMSVSGSSSSSGANITVWEMSKTANGRFYSLEKGPSPYFYIKNIAGTCMNLDGGSAGNNKNINAYTCDNTTRERWKLTAVS